MGEIERHGGAGDLVGGEGVNHDEAGIALDEGEVGEVQAAHLPDAIGDLEQAAGHVEAGHAPETGVDGGWGVCRLQEIIRREVPDGGAVGGADAAFRQAGDEAALGIGEISLIGEGELRR